jgi:hypothetical protein
MEHAVFIRFLVLVSWLFALLEIQIEGRHGWAQKLPTWRIENRWIRTFYKKPITGYHLYAQGFIFLMAHVPFGLSLVPWNLHDELRILSFVVLFWILEDFLWFILGRSPISALRLLASSSQSGRPLGAIGDSGLIVASTFSATAKAARGRPSLRELAFNRASRLGSLSSVPIL